jgi:hypothetical protein
MKLKKKEKGQPSWAAAQAVGRAAQPSRPASARARLNWSSREGLVRQRVAARAAAAKAGRQRRSGRFPRRWQRPPDSLGRSFATPDSAALLSAPYMVA